MANVSDLRTGDKFDDFFRIRDLQKKETRNGRQYLDLVLEDRTGGISAKVWEVDEQVLGEIKRGDFVKVRAVVESYQGNFQLRVQKIRQISDEDYEEGFRQEEYIEQTPFDIELMWKEIHGIARTRHPVVAEFLVSIFDRYEEKFKAWPAAQRVHHPYLGGLLEHTLSVTKTCIYLADKYEVCADLLLAAAMVHDIGKLDELSTRGGTEYTDEGKLVGHVVLGRDILREHAKLYSKLPEDFLLHLEHLILAHQGQLDWGTIKVPMTPEALLLHYADDIDAKFNIMKRTIEMDRGDESFTSWSAVMQRSFYKLRPKMSLAQGEESVAEITDDPSLRENSPSPLR